jgi:hypothetical protein
MLGQSDMRKSTLIILIAVALSARFQTCFGQGNGRGVNFGNGPQLSIMESNQSVILTWPQTPTNWVLLETPGLNTYSYGSNGVIYIDVQRMTLIPSANYGTNGTNYFVVLPIDYSTNKLYMMQTNNFPPPPQTTP